MPVDFLKKNMQTIGNYELVDKIAEGGMGTVYRGRNLSTAEIVAVKVVPPHLLNNPVVIKRFEQEYNVARQINHPNIVKALDFGQEGNSRFLVMEFVDGESLGQKIERDGRMEEAIAIKIVTQVAQGLQKAHKQGLIHRDVKPDNILMTLDGQAKLTDLGLVKELEADLNLTRTGRGLGTPHFMAPEQFRNAKKADVRCDIYSLGATLYMMVTGALPFMSNGPLDAWMKKINNEIDPPRQLVPGLSERIDWAIRRAMSPDPAQRPENCREFIEDLTGHSTKKLSQTEASLDTVQDYWYMVYHDDDGTVHTVKGTTNGIRRTLKEGLLGDASNIRMARTKAGPFDPVRQFPEFRDLVIQPNKVPTPGTDTKTLRPTTPILAQAAANSQRKKSTPPGGSIEDLTTTRIPLPANYVPPTTPPIEMSGPRINFNDTGSSVGSEIWKWVGLALVFGGGGILAALTLPMLRHFRLF
jgi:serine/threonine protein kinase